MERLRELIEKARHRLLRQAHRLEVAGNRWQANHDLAHREHKKQKELERRAQSFRHKNDTISLDKADFLKDLAKRHSHRASKAHKRALYWIDRAKRAKAKVLHLEETVEERKAKLRKLEARGAHWNGHNQVNGPDKKANLELAMRLSMEHGSQFYSQSGGLDLDHGITGPSPGHRHDCSSWFWSMLKAADIPDPTGNDYNANVWTGNEAEEGEVISESALDTGCAVFFGTAPFHHIEGKLGPMSESRDTIGHGSPPIDKGTVSLLPGPRAFRRYIK